MFSSPSLPHFLLLFRPSSLPYLRLFGYLTCTLLKLKISILKNTVAELAGKVTKLAAENKKMTDEIATQSVTPPISHTFRSLSTSLCLGSCWCFGLGGHVVFIFSALGLSPFVLGVRCFCPGSGGFDAFPVGSLVANTNTFMLHAFLL